MNRNLLTTATDYTLERPLHVDYLGVALLTLWAFLRQARQENRLEQVIHGSCPAEFSNGQIERDILRSLNVSASEAGLFARALDASMPVFGHDRLTLCYAITAKLGTPVAGWRLDEEWEMIRVAKIFFGQLDRFGLTSRGTRVRTINVCHYLFTLAKLCELGRRSAKMNLLIRFLYSEKEIDWIFDRLRFGRSEEHFQLLTERYKDDNSFGRFVVGMIRWLRVLYQSELTLVLTPLYWRSRAALAAERRLRESRVSASALIRQSEVDTVISSDQTKVEGDELPIRNVILVDAFTSATEQTSPNATDAPDAATVARDVLGEVDPRNPWSGLPKRENDNMDDRGWRKEVAKAVRSGAFPKGLVRRAALRLRRVFRIRRFRKT